jgi:pimeloyl-ACP methyl ester carboxylesterase
MSAVVRMWSRPYTLAAHPFTVRTSDGVTLRGHRTGEGSVAVVFCHGFLGWHRKGRLVRFQEELARRFNLYAFDFRGHGESGGQSTFGGREILDVDAVIRRAREEGAERVITFGGSMGGIAVTRHAALLGGVDGVVAVSTPATWSGHESAAVRKMEWLTATPSGRWVLRSSGVRVSRTWGRFEAPLEVIDRISPSPLLLVHGRDDHFFDEEQAWLLYRRAGEPKRLLLASRFGHAEDGYTAGFADLVTSAITDMVREAPRSGVQAISAVAMPRTRAGAETA